MLEKLKEQWAAALAKCEEIRTKASTENRAYSDEERTQLDTALAQMDSIDKDIKREEAIVARAAAASTTREDQTRNRPGAPATVHDNAEDAPFKSFGEMLQLVRQVEETKGRIIDPRLRKLDVTDLQVRAASGLSETIASDGGFLLTPDIAPLLQKAAFESALVAPKSTQIPISNAANSIKIPSVDETSRADGSRWGGVQAYWADEAASSTATKPKFGKVELNLKKLIGLCYTTDELLADAQALESYVTRAFSEEFAFKLDDACIRGSGAGAPLGILNAACTVSVAKETSQAAATILYANVSKMKQRMLPRSFQNAVWFTNIDTQPQLEQMTIPAKNVAGTENVGGWPAYLPPGGANANPYGMLFGRPVIQIEQCETCGTVGDIILADMGMYLMATKGGIQAASSIHVKFITDEMTYRFVMRIDGQPALKSAITPYKGTGTLSPFVTLATR